MEDTGREKTDSFCRPRPIDDDELSPRRRPEDERGTLSLAGRRNMGVDEELLLLDEESGASETRRRNTGVVEELDEGVVSKPRASVEASRPLSRSSVSSSNTDDAISTS